MLTFVESRYQADKKRIANLISNLLVKHSVSGPVEVSVSIVGDRKMRSLNKKYREKDETTNLLSFSLGEGEPAAMAGDVLRLGDVVVSYPQVIKEAAQEEVLVNDKIDELVEHGVLHLLGIHHEE